MNSGFALYIFFPCPGQLQQLGTMPMPITPDLDVRRDVSVAPGGAPLLMSILPVSIMLAYASGTLGLGLA
jgi:hypothetical protein